MNIVLRFQSVQIFEDKQKVIFDLREFLLDIFIDNFYILFFLCKFLVLVSRNLEVNKMIVLNIVIVFGLNIIRNVFEVDSVELLMVIVDIIQQLVFMMIEYEKDVFVEKQVDIILVGNFLDLEFEDNICVFKLILFNLMDCINKELFGLEIFVFEFEEFFVL